MGSFLLRRRRCRHEVSRSAVRPVLKLGIGLRVARGQTIVRVKSAFGQLVPSVTVSLYHDGRWYVLVTITLIIIKVTVRSVASIMQQLLHKM